MYDYHQGRDELLGPDDPHHSEDQVDTEAKKMRSFYELFYKRAKLLDNTETLNKGSRRLEEGYKMALETGRQTTSQRNSCLYIDSFRANWGSDYGRSVERPRNYHKSQRKGI